LKKSFDEISDEMLKKVYKAAHNAHNDVNVMAGGMTVGVSNNLTGYIGPMEFLERMYKAGAKGYFDGLSHHPYGIYARAFRDNGWANMIGDVVKSDIYSPKTIVFRDKIGKDKIIQDMIDRLDKDYIYSSDAADIYKEEFDNFHKVLQ